MSNSFDIQRNLDSQLSRLHHSVAELAQSTLGQPAPSMGDMVEFKNALMKEAAATFTDSQLGSLKHSLSKEIIDSIN
ncbi:type III secretion protein HrpF [Enterobacter sp. Ap-916]|nr:MULTISPECIES: hypothetical protein [Enterobacteriaceae]AJZ90425.1 type III secretion protein HrpF [Klebsiella michiganensis]MRT54726.1 type III secretion protein HrpF [Enterobacteriaceae bacterium RIT693]NIG74458.1 type III secretion protein HrpF [Klebsiella sp. Ap-873]AIR04129.1 type III secretion protein HrpF [Cedecea neteri]AIR61392.1 type III secretion protein HrpF [Cedecea neteri]